VTEIISSIYPLILPLQVVLPDNSLECQVQFEEASSNGDGVVDVVLVTLDFCQIVASGKQTYENFEDFFRRGGGGMGAFNSSFYRRQNERADSH